MLVIGRSHGARDVCEAYPHSGAGSLILPWLARPPVRATNRKVVMNSKKNKWPWWSYGILVRYIGVGGQLTVKIGPWHPRSVIP